VLKVGFAEEFIKLMLFILRLRRDAWFSRSVPQGGAAIASL
jgi:hypothetical protein